MPDLDEPTETAAAEEARSERLGMAVTPTEKAAMADIAAWFPEKYDGISSVLRDYTPRQAVEFAERLRSRVLSS